MLTETQNIIDYRETISSRCENIKRALTEALKDSEPIFTRIGRELQDVHSDTNALSQLAVGIGELIGDESVDGFLGSVGVLARDSIGRLKTYESEVVENIERVEANASKEDPLDPAVILAQAEMLKGQADMIEQRIEQDKLALEAKYKEADLNIDAYDSITKRMDTQVKAAKAQVDVIDSAVEQRNLQTAAPIE